MTHDEFLAALDRPRPEALPPAAAAHARSCPDCAALAQALAHVARDEGALFEPPPPSYWAGFDERLARRLPAGALPRRARRRVAAWLTAAAVLVVAAALALLRPEPGPLPATPRAARDAGSGLDDAQAGGLVVGAEPEATGGVVVGVLELPGPPAGAAEAAALLHDPLLDDTLAAVGDDLLAELPAAELRELTLKLRAEIGS